MNLLREADTGERTEQERVQYLLIVALVDNFLGQIQLSNADYDRAAQLFTAGLDAARSSPDRFTILISLFDLALSSQAGATWTAPQDCSGRGCRWRPKLATSQPPPLTS